MSKLTIVSYPLGSTVGKKSVIFDNESEKRINQLLFEVLHLHFKDDIPVEIPNEGEVLNVNLLEERKDSSLPNIRHFSLLGPHDLALLDAIDIIHEDLDSVQQRYNLDEPTDYQEALQELVEHLKQQ
ncbi:hypothetical protein [Alkalicoccobacillus porphyridii]|uniref:Uncharacterized protein n=1 Tax=Alkalicoccobacillus porphyridii TaxID=2597270 RepID=A0A553ZZZ0_9BACI|nr:hypothetical protein [Alkalicoccobacillus porphyridii]TSB47014.1 hypothetical protein FN960_08325 [Alkalicoccobacillus porphyridii]